MRQDQIERLQALQEKLVDVVLEEADSDLWPGAGTPLAECTTQQRGDRYWCKKNAAATFSLVERCTSLLSLREVDKGPLADEDDIDKQIAQREREAEKLLNSALGKARKTAFDERTQPKH